jgi:hypothetical protein
MRTAGDLVVGRRIRILLRLSWSAILVFIVWAIVMIPVIMIDSAIKDAWPENSWVPVVPIMLLVMSSLTVVWAASYTYILYRRIVDDDASPA